MTSIRTPSGERLHINRATRDTCEVHTWPLEGLAHRLVAAMRARHGKGGINCCVMCLSRARLSLQMPPKGTP